MRVLIVDDEKLARSRLQAVLADCSTLPDLQISEAADALQAMRILEQQPIDLIFLDIHMPGASGLSLAREIRHLPQVPQIIFVTAHAEHALQAFDLDAIDYLTKPISSARLQKALEKVSRVQQAREQMAQAPEKTLIIHDRGRMLRVPLAEVLYFKAELKYITVRTAQATYILDGSLTEIEQDYGAGFMRVHRNALVAKRAITTLEKHHDEEYGEGWAVRLQGIAEPIAISRRQLVNVRSAIQKL